MHRSFFFSLSRRTRVSVCGVLACVTGPGALPVSHCHADRPSVHTHYVLLTVRVTVPATSITQLRLIAYTLHRLCPSPGGGGEEGGETTWGLVSCLYLQLRIYWLEGNFSSFGETPILPKNKQQTNQLTNKQHKTKRRVSCRYHPWCK